MRKTLALFACLVFFLTACGQNISSGAWKEYKLAGYPGRDFVIETSDGKPSAYCRFYMVNNRLLQLMAMKKQSVKSTDDIDAFLRSLKLFKSR
jgi:hypothetical protein